MDCLRAKSGGDGMNEIIFYIKVNGEWIDHSTLSLSGAWSEEEIQKNIEGTLTKYRELGYEAKAERKGLQK